MRPDVLGVIGLGAIGGSVAWQAVRAGVRRVIGFSPVPAETAAAVRAGAITEGATTARFVVRESDLVVLAAPPAASLALLRSPVSETLRSGCLCTDVSGVQAPVAGRARALGLTGRFAGSHPFVSVAARGFAAAQPARFRGAIVYVTALDEDSSAAREVADFWTGVLEADTVLTDPERHDATVGWTLHLPHVVGVALAAALAVDGPRGVTYGPVAREATRAATADAERWRDLLLLNRTAVLAALDGLEGAAGRLRRALADGDARALAEWLESAASWRRRLDP
jgi:prephenate dehydrogenase